ncbi:MAG TPA: cache domain-containing protein [Magnetospirillum sp.]|nr:cache domain-containing protein [Magnetospirillum sp.]
MRAFFSAVMVVLALLAGAPAWAADRPTADQVKALTLEAAQVLQDRDLESARRAFHAEGRFKSGEIYVNVIDGNGTWLVYPPNPKHEGKSVLNVRDADGKLLVQDIIRTAREKGEGWVEYRWLNPVSNQIEPKMSYVKHLPGKDMVVYVGMYR